MSYRAVHVYHVQVASKGSESHLGYALEIDIVDEALECILVKQAVSGGLKGGSVQTAPMLNYSWDFIAIASNMENST